MVARTRLSVTLYVNRLSCTVCFLANEQVKLSPFVVKRFSPKTCGWVEVQLHPFSSSWLPEVSRRSHASASLLSLLCDLRPGP